MIAIGMMRTVDSTGAIENFNAAGDWTEQTRRTVRRKPDGIWKRSTKLRRLKSGCLFNKPDEAK
jgi:hypothetical protein